MALISRPRTVRCSTAMCLCEAATPASPAVMVKGTAQGKRYTWQLGQNELAGRRICKNCYVALHGSALRQAWRGMSHCLESNCKGCQWAIVSLHTWPRGWDAVPAAIRPVRVAVMMGWRWSYLMALALRSSS